jgi:hypothetical protein
VSKLYNAMRDYFDPELRARKERAEAAAAEKERRERERALAAEIGAVAASPVIQQYRATLLAWGESLMPVENMDASACFWFRRGLVQAVKMLDERLAAAEEQDA